MGKRDKGINQPADYYYRAYFNALNPTHFFHKSKIDKILSMIPDESAVLDAGCGSGVLIYLLKNTKGCDVAGVDIRSECVEFAINKVGTEHVYARDLTDFDLKRQFDVVTCLDVIEHFDPAEVGRVLGNLDRHVRRGGRLIIAFPTDFYINVVEKVWKIVRKVLMPGIRFDDEEVHNAVKEGEIKGHLKRYTVEDEGSSSLGLVRYIVLRKG